MGRVKVLLDVVSDMRALADSLQYAAEMILGESDEEREEDDYVVKRKIEKTPESEVKPDEEKLEEVRAFLAKKSQEGYVDEIKKIIKSYNASKLSEVDPIFYEEIKKSVESLDEGDD